MGCGRRLEGAVKQVKGVQSASLEIKTGILTVMCDSAVTDDSLKAAIARSPFKLVVLEPVSP